MSLIKAICSAEGDVIILKTMVPMTGAVEDWLNQLVVEIRFTMIDLTSACAKFDQFNENQITVYPVQALCTAKAISFTRQTEKAINSMGLQALQKNIKDEIAKYSSAEFVSLDSLCQLKIKSLLLDLVHYAAILDGLIKEGVTSLTDWLWLQQLKFYINQNQIVVIKMVYAEFEYSYEYLGNPNKLVNTSLTHNCYLTLTQAMQLGMGGNPFGPAGTGKTECVKSLGSMFGRLVLVFNCSEVRLYQKIKQYLSTFIFRMLIRLQ